MHTRIGNILQHARRQRKIIRAGKEPFVVFPLDRWQELEDALREFVAPRLRRSVRAGRAAYRAGKTIPYDRIRQQLGLA